MSLQQYKTKKSGFLNSKYLFSVVQQDFYIDSPISDEQKVFSSD